MRILFVIAAVALLSPIQAPTAECASCFNVACFNSSGCAGVGCVCIKFGGDTNGQCASINLIDDSMTLLP